MPIPPNDRVLRVGGAVPGPAPRVPRGGPGRGAPVPADDSGRVPRRRPAAGPGLRAADRKRVQADRAVAREGPRRLAVHAAAPALENGLRHDWYIDERADPEKATRRRREVPEDAAQHVRRLAPGAGVLQRRPRPRAARDEAQPASTTSGISARPRGSCRARRATTCR